jgi:hypothetical protein
MVSENSVLSRILGPKRDEVTGERRKLKRERGRETCWYVFIAKYLSGDQIKKKICIGSCSTYGGKERCARGPMYW